MEVNRLRYLCIEIYKSINNMKQNLSNRTEQFDTFRNEIAVFPKSIRLVMVKKFWDIMGLKSGKSSKNLKT